MPTFSNDFMKLQLNSQINLEREPLLTWKQTEPASFKKDYFVPSFGADPDIDASLNHSKDLTLPAETVDKDGEDVFPYQDEKFKVESHYKFVPIQNSYTPISEFKD